MFLLAPIWLLAMVERTRNPSRKATILAVVLVTVTAAVLPVRAYDLLHAMGSHCKKCRVAIPYDGLATALKERGFHSGTIIAESRHDAGNLRRFFPQARISCLESPSYVPPLRGERGDQVALVLKPKSRVKYLRDAETGRGPGWSFRDPPRRGDNPVAAFPEVLGATHLAMVGAGARSCRAGIGLFGLGARRIENSEPQQFHFWLSAGNYR